MARPFLEAEPFLLAAGRHVQGHHGSFNHKGAGTAHRVHEIAAGRGNFGPACAHQQCGSQVFFQWCYALIRAIAAHVQAVPAQINAQGQTATIESGGDNDIRVFGVHRRPRSAIGLKPIHNAVLDPLGTILRVADGLILTKESHPEAAMHRDMLLPVHVHNAVIELIAAVGIHFVNVKDHAVGQARPEARAVATFQRALYPDSGRRVTHGFQAKRAELVRQKVFHSLRAGYEKDRFGQVQLLVQQRLLVSFRNTGRSEIGGIFLVHITIKKASHR